MLHEAENVPQILNEKPLKVQKHHKYETTDYVKHHEH